MLKVSQKTTVLTEERSLLLADSMHLQQSTTKESSDIYPRSQWILRQKPQDTFLSYCSQP